MRRSYILVQVIWLTLMVPAAAFGTECSPLPDVSEAYGAAAVVFFGKVIEADDFHIKFKVERRWKGVESDEVVLVTDAVELGNGIVYNRDTLRRFNFVLGKKYLVYAERVPKGLYAYRCSRTKPKGYAKKDLTELERLHKRKD